MTGKPEAPTITIGDARRLQIVQAAREICLEKGFSKITISDIAERVGMTRSLFYHYFQDSTMSSVKSSPAWKSGTSIARPATSRRRLTMWCG